MNEVFTNEFLFNNNWAYTRVHDFTRDTFHMHTFYEIVYHTSGQSKNLINEKEIGLNPNEILIMKPGILHKIIHDFGMMHRDIYCSDEKMKKLLSFFSQAFQDYIQQSECIVFPLPSATLSVIERFMQNFDVTELQSDLDDLHTCIIMFILGQLRHIPLAVDSKPAWLQSFVNALSRAALTDQKVADLIKSTNYSYGHVAREFKRHLHISIKDYIMKERINFAAFLLLTTNKNISDIAYSVGFNSIVGFSTVFKKFHNVSPGQFRTVNTQASIHPGLSTPEF